LTAPLPVGFAAALGGGAFAPPLAFAATEIPAAAEAS